MLIAGQPARRVAAGQGFVVPAGTLHNARNEGATALKRTAAYVVRKGVPLVATASEP